MTYPIPPDARVPQNFDIVRGFDTMQRHDHYISDINAGLDTAPTEVLIGEPLRYLDVAGQALETAYVINDAVAGAPAARVVGDTTARSERFCGVCWTFYTNTFEGGGFPDALGNRKVTVLKGKFTARMKISDLFLTTATTVAAPVDPAIGRKVVVVNVDDGTDQYGRYMCIADGSNPFAGANPTSDEIVQNVYGVVGVIDRVDGDYVDVNFDV